MELIKTSEIDYHFIVSKELARAIFIVSEKITGSSTHSRRYYADKLFKSLHDFLIANDKTWYTSSYYTELKQFKGVLKIANSSIYHNVYVETAEINGNININLHKSVFKLIVQLCGHYTCGAGDYATLLAKVWYQYGQYGAVNGNICKPPKDISGKIEITKYSIINPIMNPMFGMHYGVSDPMAPYVKIDPFWVDVSSGVNKCEK